MGMTTIEPSAQAWNDMVQQLTTPDIQTLEKVYVDENIWYLVKLSMPAQEWIRAQPRWEWYEHVSVDSGLFDVSEKLYTALTLKWK